MPFAAMEAGLIANEVPSWNAFVRTPLINGWSDGRKPAPSRDKIRRRIPSGEHRLGIVLPPRQKTLSAESVRYRLDYAVFRKITMIPIWHTTNDVMVWVRDRFVAVHIECGATQEQAAAAWERVISRPCSFTWPTREQLDALPPMTPDEQRAFKEWRTTGFAREKQARRDRLKAFYAGLNREQPPAIPIALEKPS
ncbi:MAG: hypothetical protein ABSC06_07205 [Rhodopila sp.]